jgi:hypothetical protein
MGDDGHALLDLKGSWLGIKPESVVVVVSLSLSLSLSCFDWHCHIRMRTLP